MEDIEYLEEYEDMVLPTLQSSNAIANQQSMETDTEDEDSSSIDQDIFETIFDDQSDDDDDLVPPPKLDPKTILQDRQSVDSLDFLVKDFGRTLLPESISIKPPVIKKKDDIQTAMKPTTSKAAQKVQPTNIKQVTTVPMKKQPIRMPPLKKDVPKTMQKITNLSAKILPIRNQAVASTPKPKILPQAVQLKNKVEIKKTVGGTTSAAAVGAVSVKKPIQKKEPMPKVAVNDKKEELFFSSSDDSYDNLSGYDDSYLEGTDFDSDLSDLSDSDDYQIDEPPPKGKMKSFKKPEDTVNAPTSKVVNDKVIPKVPTSKGTDNVTKSTTTSSCKTATTSSCKTTTTSSCETTKSIETATPVVSKKKAGENTKESVAAVNYDEIAELERELNTLRETDNISVNNETEKQDKDDKDQQTKKNMVVADSTTVDDTSPGTSNAINKDLFLRNDVIGIESEVQIESIKPTATVGNKTTDTKGSGNSENSSKIENKLPVKAGVNLNKDNDNMLVEKNNETKDVKKSSTTATTVEATHSQKSKSENIDKSKNIKPTLKKSSPVQISKKQNVSFELPAAKSTKNGASIAKKPTTKSTTNLTGTEDRQSLKKVQKNALAKNTNKNEELDKNKQINIKGSVLNSKITNKSASPIKTKQSESSALENIKNVASTSDKNIEKVSPEKAINEIEKVPSAIQPSPDVAAKVFDVKKYKIPKIIPKQVQTGTTEKPPSTLKKAEVQETTPKKTETNEVKTIAITAASPNEKTVDQQKPTETKKTDSEITKNSPNKGAKLTTTNAKVNNTENKNKISTKKQAKPQLILPFMTRKGLSNEDKTTPDNKKKEIKKKSMTDEKLEVTNNCDNPQKQIQLPAVVAEIAKEKGENEKDNSEGHAGTATKVPSVSETSSIEPVSETLIDINKQEIAGPSAEIGKKKDSSEAQQTTEIIATDAKNLETTRKRKMSIVQTRNTPSRAKKVKNIEEEQKAVPSDTNMNTEGINKKDAPPNTKLNDNVNDNHMEPENFVQGSNKVNADRLRKSPRLIEPKKSENISSNKNDVPTIFNASSVETPTTSNRRKSQDKVNKVHANEPNIENIRKKTESPTVRREPLEALKAALIAQKLKILDKKNTASRKKILLKASANENALAFKGKWFKARIRLNRCTVPKYFEQYKSKTGKKNSPALQKTHEPLICLDPEQNSKATSLVKSPAASSTNKAASEVTTEVATTSGVKQPKLPITTGRAQVFTIPPQHRRAPLTKATTTATNQNIEPHTSRADGLDSVDVLVEPDQSPTSVAPIRKSLRPHKRKILSPSNLSDDEDSVDNSSTNEDHESPKKKPKKQNNYQAKKDNKIQVKQSANNIILPSTSSPNSAVTRNTNASPTTTNHSPSTIVGPKIVPNKTKYFSFRKAFRPKCTILDDLKYSSESPTELSRKNPLIVSTKVLELPAFISMTTKLITRSNLNDKNIPERIRRQFGIKNPPINNTTPATILKPAPSCVVPAPAPAPAPVLAPENNITVQQETTMVKSDISLMRQSMRKCTLLLQEFKYNHPKLTLMQQRNCMDKLILSPDIDNSDITCFHDVLEKYIKIIRSQIRGAKVLPTARIATSAPTTGTTQSQQPNIILTRQVNIRTDGVAVPNSRNRNTSTTVLPVAHNNIPPLSAQDIVMRENPIVQDSPPTQNSMHKVSINVKSQNRNGSSENATTVFENVVVYTGDSSFDTTQTSVEESILPDYQASKSIIKNENTTDDDIIGD